MTQAALKVDHLTKDFGHGRGIFDVSFEIHPGEVFGFRFRQRAWP